jgi:fatty acid desaturase
MPAIGGVMALPPGEEQAFQALVHGFEQPQGHRARRLAWAALIIACVCAVGSAGALRIPWLAVLGWLGLIAAGLAGVAVPRDR